MIRINPDFFEVVVLAACTDTFLAVGGASVTGFCQTEEDILELVHTRVGKQQCRIANRNNRRAMHGFMAALLKKLYKVAAYLISCKHNSLPKNSSPTPQPCLSRPTLSV